MVEDDSLDERRIAGEQHRFFVANYCRLLIEKSTAAEQLAKSEAASKQLLAMPQTGSRDEAIRLHDLMAKYCRAAYAGSSMLADAIAELTENLDRTYIATGDNQ